MTRKITSSHIFADVLSGGMSPHQARQTLLPGEHIWCSRGLLMIHAGIYTEAGTVIHNSPGEGVKETSLETFTKDALIRRGSSVSRYTPAEIVARARGQINQETYHLLDNNCQHFVNWCRNGVRCMEGLIA